MTRNGADALVEALVAAGVDTCFANPGTTEMHLLAALGRHPGMHTHLCVFEGVASGAADGYARMTGKPAATLLHLGPGFANAMANLHNAKKANSAVVNIVGEHATYHLELDAPLTADIEGMAETVSDVVATLESADEVSAATNHALAEIAGPSARVATLVLPNDVAWSPTDVAGEPVAPAPALEFDAQAVARAARTLSEGGSGVALLLGAPFVTARMASLADAIQKKTGCRLFAESAVSRMERGGDTPPLPRVPFHVDPATEALAEVWAAVLVGARAPVAFFAYPGRRSELLPKGCETIAVSPLLADAEKALEALAAALEAKPEPHRPTLVAPADRSAVITPETLAATVAHALPEQAIVVDESITNGGFLYAYCGDAGRHDWINNRGGSIGYSTPVAVGAAVACPDRRVLTITGDGSALYTLQSLWSMARDQLDITVLILANRSYKILANEMSKIGAGNPGEREAPLLSLDHPEPQWTQLAQGFGVSAERATTVAELDAALRGAFSSSGPRLIEVVM
ncbi:acetolactate synthase large subunit [Amorphus sp. 3PC139-8]|uniref:acetolactate synthase large subunit n=1 Tax=Amorphus sp. 3PC139-8 TaxID=2735676 RepID=UPI00345DBD92